MGHYNQKQDMYVMEPGEDIFYTAKKEDFGANMQNYSSSNKHSIFAF